MSPEEAIAFLREAGLYGTSFRSFEALLDAAAAATSLPHERIHPAGLPHDAECPGCRLTAALVALATAVREQGHEPDEPSRAAVCRCGHSSEDHDLHRDDLTGRCDVKGCACQAWDPVMKPLG